MISQRRPLEAPPRVVGNVPPLSTVFRFVLALIVMRAFLVVSLCASAACLRTVALPAVLRRAGVSMRPGVQLCEVDDEATTRSAAAKRAQEIRLQAERLALQAERAALEAEQLTLQVEQIKLATAQRRMETDASGATTPEPERVDELPPKPLDRDPWVADAIERESPAPALDASAGGIFNISVAGLSNGSAPLKGQLQQALEIRGLREPSELQVTPAQAALIKSEVFDIDTFYTMKAPRQTRAALATPGGPSSCGAPQSAHPARPTCCLITPVHASGRGLPCRHHLSRQSARRCRCVVVPNSEALTPAVRVEPLP